jgi:NADH dehydrogenase FAD-containing subunit
MTNRRNFLKLMGLGTLASLNPLNLNAATTPQIIVIGGGFAGATCAKYLKIWGGDSVNVTIIEENSSYVSPILSNLVLNRQKTTAENLTFSYTPLKDKYEVRVVNKIVSSISKSTKTITLSDGSTMTYNKLVLAPGIDFKYTNSYDINKIPHAWKSGDQINILRDQIQTLTNGDKFIMSIPKSPFRCPPGPYERACVIADYLKNKKGINVSFTVLDENNDIIVEKTSFMAKFNEYGIIYKPSCVVTNVNDTNKTITYKENGGADINYTANVINVIPNQKAAKIIFDTGLDNSKGWASVDTKSYQSILDRHIHIIGDSQGSSQPKAGHIANSEAKVCADAILRTLNNEALYANPKTNSACYSPVSSNEATWLTAVYEYDSGTKDMKLSTVTANAFPASRGASTSNYNDMFYWTGNLFSDTFK